MASITDNSETLYAGSEVPIPATGWTRGYAVAMERRKISRNGPHRNHWRGRPGRTSGRMDRKENDEVPTASIGDVLLRETLQRHIPEGWYVDSQEPVTLAASEPEPDVVLVRGNPRDYGDHHPGPDNVALGGRGFRFWSVAGSGFQEVDLRRGRHRHLLGCQSGRSAD